MIQINHNGFLYYPPEVGEIIFHINPGTYSSNHRPFVETMVVREVSCKTIRGQTEWGIVASNSRWKLSNCGKTWFRSEKEARAALAQQNQKKGTPA